MNHPPASRSSPSPADEHGHPMIDTREVLGLGPPSPRNLLPQSAAAGRQGVAEQSLARGMAAARILEARNTGSRSFPAQRSNGSPSISARGGSRSPRERSPPKSPRTNEGMPGNSSSSRNLQLQPWQISAEVIASSVEESRTSKLRSAPAGSKSSKSDMLLMAVGKGLSPGPITGHSSADSSAPQLSTFSVDSETAHLAAAEQAAAAAAGDEVATAAAGSSSHGSCQQRQQQQQQHECNSSLSNSLTGAAAAVGHSEVQAHTSMIQQQQQQLQQDAGRAVAAVPAGTVVESAAQMRVDALQQVPVHGRQARNATKKKKGVFACCFGGTSGSDAEEEQNPAEAVAGAAAAAAAAAVSLPRSATPQEVVAPAAAATPVAPVDIALEFALGADQVPGMEELHEQQTSEVLQADGSAAAAAAGEALTISGGQRSSEIWGLARQEGAAPQQPVAPPAAAFTMDTGSTDGLQLAGKGAEAAKMEACGSPATEDAFSIKAHHFMQGAPANTSAISAFVFGPAGLQGPSAHSQLPGGASGASAAGISFAVSCSSLGPSYGGSSRCLAAAAAPEAGHQLGSAGGAGMLSQRMSSGRRFSRQGSRMRQASRGTSESLAGDAGSSTMYPVLFAPPPAVVGPQGLLGTASAAPGSTAAWSRQQLRSGTPDGNLDGFSTAASSSRHKSGTRGSRSSAKSSQLPKVTPWANLERQIHERQGLQQQQLEKQLAVERRLAEQQALLKQQLEALRQIRSRSPSPMRGTSSSMDTSGGCSSVLDTCGGRGYGSRSGSPGHHRPGTCRNRSPLIGVGVGTSAAAVASSAVNLGELLRSQQGSAPHVQHSSRRATPQRSRGISRDDVTLGQQAQHAESAAASLAAAETSKKQLRAAAESLLTSLEHGVPMCPDALASLLGACNDPAAAAAAAALAASTTVAQEVRAMQEQPGQTAAGVAAVLGLNVSSAAAPVQPKVLQPAQDTRMQQQEAGGSSTQPKKKPFVLVLPRHDTTSVYQRQQQQAIVRTSSRSTAGGNTGSSTFKIPNNLLSLSFKKKSPKPPSQQRPKTYRAFYRQPGMSPKAPAVKYSSFKVAAKLLHPKPSSSPRLMLISPSSRFNSRRILAGLNTSAAQQASAVAHLELPGVEGMGVKALAALKGLNGINALALAESFRGASSSSTGWSLRTQQSFAMSGEVIADAADEETAGTAAPNPAVLCTTQSTAQLHNGLGSLPGGAAGGVFAGLSNAAGAAAAAIAATVAHAHAAAAKAASTATPASAAPPVAAAAARSGASKGASSHSLVPPSPKQPSSPAAASRAVAAAAGRRPSSASPSKPPAYVPARRATADVASVSAASRMQRSSPVQGRTAGSLAAGAAAHVAAGDVKGSLAAAEGGSIVAAPRRATVDAGAKGALHLMSRNCYLQLLKQQAGHPETSSAIGSKSSATKATCSSPAAATAKAAADFATAPQQQQQMAADYEGRSSPASPVALSSHGCSSYSPSTAGALSPGAAAAEAAARQAASQIASLALNSMLGRSSGSDGFSSEGLSDLGPSATELGSAGGHNVYEPSSSVWSAGCVESEGGSASEAGARTAAAAAVAAVSAAADARTAEARAAAEAALLAAGVPMSESIAPQARTVTPVYADRSAAANNMQPVAAAGLGGVRMPCEANHVNGILDGGVQQGLGEGSGAAAGRWQQKQETHQLVELRREQALQEEQQRQHERHLLQQLQQQQIQHQQQQQQLQHQLQQQQHDSQQQQQMLMQQLQQLLLLQQQQQQQQQQLQPALVVQQPLAQQQHTLSVPSLAAWQMQPQTQQAQQTLPVQQQQQQGWQPGYVQQQQQQQQHFAPPLSPTQHQASWGRAAAESPRQNDSPGVTGFGY